MNLYDCHGGPGTTEPACGACVTCLHRVIEQKDQRIKRLEEAGQRVEDAAYSIQDWNGTALGDALDELNKAKEVKP